MIPIKIPVYRSNIRNARERFLPQLRIKSVISILRERKLAALFHMLGPVGTVLDIGASISPYRQYISAEQFYAMDISSSASPSLVSDAHLLCFAENTIDLVLLTEILEHCHSPWIVLENVFRVLKPGGMVIITVPFTFMFHPNPNDYYRFTSQGLEHLLRQFSEVTVDAYGSRFQMLFQTINRGVARLFLNVLNPIVASGSRTDVRMPLGYIVYCVK